MTLERYDALMRDDSLTLTEEEVRQGWHFCCEWDGLLIHPSDAEYGYGSCCTLDESPPPRAMIEP